MTQHNAIKLFETKKVRTIWDDKEEKWYFSIVDVVAVLTDSPNPVSYTHLDTEGIQICISFEEKNNGSILTLSQSGRILLVDFVQKNNISCISHNVLTSLLLSAIPEKFSPW